MRIAKYAVPAQCEEGTSTQCDLGRRRRDLRWFYERWFQQTGALDWSVAWEQQRDSVVGTVRLGPSSVNSTVEVRLAGVGGKGCPAMRRHLTLSGLVTRFRWQIPCHIDSVTLDPNFQFLHWTPEYRAIATALAPYTRANLLLASGADADAEAAFRAALADAPAANPHGPGSCSSAASGRR
ncbi:MAG: hypothetical protein ABR543_15800 [Gemmatimonadaceae bacterium]